MTQSEPTPFDRLKPVLRCGQISLPAAEIIPALSRCYPGTISALSPPLSFAAGPQRAHYMLIVTLCLCSRSAIL